MRQVPAFRLIFPFFFVIAIDAMCHGIVTPVLAPLMLKASGSTLGLPLDVAMRHVMYGVIQMISTFCYMIGAPLLGYFSDKIGRRKMIFYCVLGSTLGLLGYAISFALNNLTILLLARVIVGFSTGSLAVAQSAIADVSTGAEKAKNIGMIAVAMTIGLVAGPLIGGVLSDTGLYAHFTNVTPFYAAILLSLVNLVLLIKMPETHHEMVNEKKYHFGSSLKKLVLAHGMPLLLLTFFLFELGWSLYFQSLAVVLVQNFNFSNQSLGFFMSYVGLVVSLGLFYGVRWVVARYALKAIIQPSLVIGIFALACGFFVTGIWVQIIIAIPISIAVAFCYAILITLASDKTDPNRQGLLMGTTDCLLALAFTITGFLAGVLTISNALLPQIVAAIFWILGIGVFGWHRKTRESL